MNNSTPVTSPGHNIEWPPDNVTPGSHEIGGSRNDVTQLGHVCTECKQPLPSETWDRRAVKRVTCSARCRKRRERRQKDQHAAWILAMHQLQQMRDGIKRGEQLKDFRDQLIRLKDEINDLLVLVNDEDAVARRNFLSERSRRRQW